MSLWSYIPTRGEMSTRKKIKKLEREAGSLPIIFGVFVTKVFENAVLLDLMAAARFGIAAIVTALIYIYNKEVASAARETAEKAKVTVTEGEE